MREVLAMKGVKICSALLDPHFGHLSRLRSRSVMVMVTVYFFRHAPQRKSYVGMGTPGESRLVGLVERSLRNAIANP